MPSPLVSIIIPTYNRREWIGECLDSVLAQTYKNFEIIVVDDVSTDGTVEWLRGEPRYKDVRVHVQDVNGGASTARNTGIEMAGGELIAFIDSDDMLLPEHLAKAVAAFGEHKDLGLFCCDSRMIDARGDAILGGKTWHQALSEAKGKRVETGFRGLADVFDFSNCFPGFTLRREVFSELGGFDQTLFPADDYDLALRVAGSRFKVFYLHEPLCLRREHDGQCSGIDNSVKTQVKLIEALETAASREPERLGTSPAVRRRLAEVRMELGMCEIKEGRRGRGAVTIARSVLESPSQMREIKRIGGRKLRKMAGDPRKA
jgi:glycosyltransferase involved in cell wall biosynthesis